ncbi:MepB family protein [Flammeovirga sp. EKP202]|uniref:MepB family protein n=1 Tax=Flammeovirga sp. EKP202 TaxID=2770592 RepID=UPI00165F3E2D|nr:MepB family protein [Flammeovirga sp. EKP202]MBD0401260.1 MepB family protein [Flammeovirga sp. EKP202]
MNDCLNSIKTSIYDKCSLLLDEISTEIEGKEYDACRFKLNSYEITYRKAKVTPKKVGQFVTFWKRDEKGNTTPFHTTDTIDFYIITVQYGMRLGQFIFPKSTLIEKGIMGSDKQEGKRGFRVYPIWDVVTSKQAIQTQKWQLNYFYEVTSSTDLDKVSELFKLS